MPGAPQCGVVLAALVLVLGWIVVAGAGGFAPAQGVLSSATAALDSLGSTRGQVLYRGASAWTVLSPGTSGSVLLSGGAGADPSWGAAAGGGVTEAGFAWSGGTQTVTAGNTWDSVVLSGGSVSFGGSTVSGSVITISNAGTYLVSYYTQLRMGANVGAVRLLEDGVEINGSQRVVASDGAGLVGLSASSLLVSMNAGGTIQMQIGSTGGTGASTNYYDDGNLPNFTNTWTASSRVTWVRLGN